ncbi:TetR family transcriptional regulator [Actinocorallia longicatena]|uniref:TetR family transcriptional regulator n=1 Tax=Actinocorallia longicatena TaxID=111803 RepID=A0ABP6QBB2_9ACTN
MTEAVLTPDRILDAAEDVLRRFGPAKATVLDVARALNVSHGSVYRHFKTKAALRDAVTERWLARVSTRLREITAAGGDAQDRLRQWLDTLVECKHRLARTDPELFATYTRLTDETREVVTAHVADLAAQLGRIIADGNDQGLFAAPDPLLAGRAVLSATARFHNPVNIAEWSDPALSADYAAVLDLLLNGLRTGRPE